MFPLPLVLTKRIPILQPMLHFRALLPLGKLRAVGPPGSAIFHEPLHKHWEEVVTQLTAQREEQRKLNAELSGVMREAESSRDELAKKARAMVEREKSMRLTAEAEIASELAAGEARRGAPRKHAPRKRAATCGY